MYINVWLNLDRLDESCVVRTVLSFAANIITIFNDAVLELESEAT